MRRFEPGSTRRHENWRHNRYPAPTLHLIMKLSSKLFEVCRQDGSPEQREAAAFVLAGQYVVAGDHDRALEAARSIHMPQADPRIMEVAALAASGKLDEAESIAHRALEEKESDVSALQDILSGIQKKRNDR